MFRRPRIIPCLLIDNQDLVKTIKFSNPRFLGDPVNAVKIFNGKGVDELCVLDISASKEKKEPDFNLLKDIASEAFMPLSYGGGLTTLEQVKNVFNIGFEKVIINTSFVDNPEFLTQTVRYAGSQSVVVSLDVKTDILGKRSCYIEGGKTKIGTNPIVMAQTAERLGAGEILLNSINRDGMMQGYDIKLVKDIVSAVGIPVIACGGAGGIEDLKQVLTEGNAHAAAAGSMFVYYGKLKAVLINMPSEKELIEKKVYAEE